MHPSPACLKIVEAMKEGGFYDTVMAGGPGLDRVKHYLLALAGERPSPGVHPLQNPKYPCFPGLRHQPFRDGAEIPGVVALERAFETVRNECLALRDDDYIRYSPGSMVNVWAVYLFAYMGARVEPLIGRCPATYELLTSLPGLCIDYPWGDALFSLHASKAHLKAHCSIDNLRVRCHLGIVVPPDCEMRVGTEIRTWEEGKGLVFEDSFEHEVWNRSDGRRIILIVDFWHPDLTQLEIRALTAGFRKYEVRKVIFWDRIRMSNASPEYLARLDEELQRQEDDPAVREFWRS